MMKNGSHIVLMLPGAWTTLSVVVIFGMGWFHMEPPRAFAQLLIMSNLLTAPAGILASIGGAILALWRWKMHAAQRWFLPFHVLLGLISVAICIVMMNFPRINLM